MILCCVFFFINLFVKQIFIIITIIIKYFPASDSHIFTNKLIMKKLCMLKVEFLVLYIKEKKNYSLEKWRINCYRIKNEIIIRCIDICTIIPRIFLIYYPILKIDQ